MLKTLATLLLAAVAACAANQRAAVLSGTVTDCDDDQVIGIRQIEVKALDPATNRDLVALLRSMDTVTWVGNGVESMARFEPMYGRMLGLLRRSTTLARDSTTEEGSFSLSVAASDSVLLIADAQVEDEPVYYAYRMVGARKHTTVELDMSHGQCPKPIPPGVPRAVVTGTARACAIRGGDPTENVRWLDVRVFDPVSNQDLMAGLKNLDALRRKMPDPEAAKRYDVAAARLWRLRDNASPVGRRILSLPGSFSLTIAAADSVLVLSVNDEAPPSYYEYKIVGARSNVSFQLNISGASCEYRAPAGHSGPIPDSVWHTQKLPPGYALTDTSEWENAIGWGGNQALLRRAGTTIDTVDLTFGVVSVGTDSLVFVPVRSGAITPGDSLSWVETSPIDHVLWTPTRRRELREFVPLFLRRSSPIVTNESIMYYWGITRADQAFSTYAMRYNFRTAQVDSLFLREDDMATDRRFHLSEPEISATEVSFGGHRMDRKTWGRIPNHASRN
jgi:hypothetical protein